MTRTSVYPVNLKFAVTGYVCTDHRVVILLQRCLHYYEKETAGLRLDLTTSGVFCLFLFRMLHWHLVVLEFSVFYRQKSVGPTADSLNEENDPPPGNATHVRLGRTLDA